MFANHRRQRSSPRSLVRGVRRSIEVTCVGATLAFAAAAQATLYEWTGTDNDFGRNQRSVTGIDDVDGDGVPDLLIGKPRDVTLGPLTGRADVVSGRDGSLIRSIYGRATPNGFGGSTSRLDDIDGDGVEDFAIGAPVPGGNLLPLTKPYVRIISGRTGTLLREFESAVVSRWFGASIRPTPDVDGDGHRELLIGACCYPDDPAIGAVVDLVSPATGATLREFSGTYWDTTFGWSVDAAGDLDGDGVTEILVGSPFDTPPNAPSSHLGSARVYSAVTGAQVAAYYGNLWGSWAGATVAGLGDVDSDGVSDFAIGSSAVDYGALLNSRVDVRSGATGALLYTVSDPGMQLGWTIEPTGDQDGDGVADFVVFARSLQIGTPSLLRVVSGRTGATIVQVAGSPSLLIGPIIVDAGDINGDGRRDLLVERGETTDPNAQRVQLVLLGAEAPTAYCIAKTNSLGCVPAISSSGGASLSVGDNFTVSAINVLNNKPGVLLWSASALNAPFAGGTLCVAPASFSIRGPVLDSGGLVPPWNDCSGAYSFHFSHALMNSRGLTAGTTLYAQFISRDNGFAPPRNIGLTDALRFTVAP